MSSDKNMSLFHSQMLWNLVAFIMLIYSLGHVVVERPQARESWRDHLIVKKVQLLIHAESASPVLI
jgi:hypothetical protein